jgi:hypothetical protein
MSHRAAVITRADGSKGSDMACGLRLVYAATSGEALVELGRRDVSLFVIVGYAPSVAARIAARARRRSQTVGVVALVRPPTTPSQERTIIDAGADAVAYYPMPHEAWSKLWRMVVERRQQWLAVAPG